jgi:hypothetical protein
MTYNKFIIKTYRKGVKVLTINNSFQTQTLLDNDDMVNLTDSLAL